jgi:hypothetical protein
VVQGRRLDAGVVGELQHNHPQHDQAENGEAVVQQHEGGARRTSLLRQGRKIEVSLVLLFSFFDEYAAISLFSTCIPRQDLQ